MNGICTADTRCTSRHGIMTVLTLFDTRTRKNSLVIFLFRNALYDNAGDAIIS